MKAEAPTRWWKGGVLVLGAAVVVLGMTQWKIARAIVANTMAMDAFGALPEQPAVRYTAGSEAPAVAIAAALPAAVARVEQAHVAPFPAPVVVYVCGTATCFERHTTRVRPTGVTIGGMLFIAHRLAEQPERILTLLTHELSHLHMAQSAGLLRAMRLPPWFHEGLAVTVSGGGGAEHATRAAAAQAIRAGQPFDPTDAGGLLWRRTASDYGLQPHVFYRQAGMFLDFVRELNPNAFTALLRRLEAGHSLAVALQTAYGATPSELWRSFVAALPATD